MLNHRLELITPSSEFANSYRALVCEFVDRGEKLIPFTLSFSTEPFSGFLEKIAACSRGEGIPANFVPHSTYWLIEGAEVVGVSNIRHRLTDALKREGGNIGYGIRPSQRQRGFAHVLLQQTLLQARNLGLSEVWLTCAKANVASIRTIVRSGGSLVSEEYLEPRGEIVQRYSIDLANAANAL